MNKGVAAAEPDVSERRMRAVEHPQFRRLIGRNVGDEFGANRLPARARAGEILLDYPLAEAFGDHRALVEIGKHTSELQSLMRISYAVFCLKKKNNTRTP